MAWLRVGICGLVLLMTVTITTGCWDRVEINDLAIIQGVALDRVSPNLIRVTVALVVPARISTPSSPGTGGGRPPIITKAADGRTVMEAASVLQEKLSRKLLWCHTEVIFIGEELAREGVAPALEFFSRQRESRLRTVVAVTPGRAADILSVVQSIEINTSVAIRELEGFNLREPITLRDLAAMMVADGEDPLVGRISIVPSGAIDPGNGDPRQVAFDGTAVFRGDRLVGFLDEHLTRGILWVRDDMKASTLTVQLGNTNRYVGFLLLNASSEVKPRFDGDRLVMDVRVRAQTELDDNGAGVDVSDPEVLRLLEGALDRLVEDRILEATNKAQQEFGSDVMRFGTAVRRTFPAYWLQIEKQWSQILPTVSVNVQADITIRRFGMSTRPLGVSEEGVLKAEQVRSLLEGE